MADEEKKKKKKDLQNELGDLLKNFDTAFVKNRDSSNVDDIIDEKIREANDGIRPTFEDFDDLDRKFKSKALDVISSMYDFYMDFGVIEQDDYTKRKKDIDSMNMSNIFLQLKLIKVTLSKLMDEIVAGNTVPRMFEAFASINAQFSDTIRASANYLLFLEQSYQRKRIEALNAAADGNARQITQGSTAVVSTSEYYVTADQKALMGEIKQSETGTEYVIDKDHALTNPTNKDDLMEKMDIKIDKSKQADDYEGIIDMI